MHVDGCDTLVDVDALLLLPILAAVLLVGHVGVVGAGRLWLVVASFPSSSISNFNRSDRHESS